MKKLRYGVIFLGGVILLSSCGTSPREEFANKIDEMNANQQNQIHFSVAFKEISIDASTVLPEDLSSFKEILPELNHAKINGDMLTNGKLTNADFIVQISDKPLPMKLFLERKNGKQTSYFSAKTWLDLLSIINPNKQIQLTPEESKQIEEGYIATETINIPKEATADDQLLLSDFIKTLPKKSFKKEKNTLTHTFTKEEWNQFVQTNTKKADKDTKSLFKQLDPLWKNIQSSSDRLSINMDTNQWMLHHRSVSKAGKKLDFTVDMQVKKTKKKPVQVNKTTILSETELIHLLATAQSRISPKEFDEFYQKLAENKEYIDNQKLQEFIQKMKPYLLPEQIQKLEDLGNN